MGRVVGVEIPGAGVAGHLEKTLGSPLALTMRVVDSNTASPTLPTLGIQVSGQVPSPKPAQPCSAKDAWPRGSPALPLLPLGISAWQLRAGGMHLREDRQKGIQGLRRERQRWGGSTGMRGRDRNPEGEQGSYSELERGGRWGEKRQTDRQAKGWWARKGGDKEQRGRVKK